MKPEPTFGYCDRINGDEPLAFVQSNDYADFRTHETFGCTLYELRLYASEKTK